MANIKAHAGAINLDSSAPIEETFVDNGDGTYARLVEAVGTVADGANVAQGATTDASSASTVIGLLKNLKAALAGILSVKIDQTTPGTTNAVAIADGAATTLGTTTDAASASTLVGLLKNIKAALAGILSVKIDQTTPGSTNAVSVTTLPALPTGTNSIGRITIADGGDATVGTTTDAASASTLVGLLKNLKAALAGKLATTVADGDNATIGTTTDASSALTLVGLLKNIKAALAGIISVKIDQTTPGTTNAVAILSSPARTNKASFGTSNQAITITSAAALANNAQASSAAVDNTTNLFLDALVAVKVTTAGSGTVSTGTINVYAYGTADGGATYGGGEANMGTDHSVTLTSPPNIRLIGVVNAVAISTSYEAGPFSVAAAFGGVLPSAFGIVLENKSGGALTAASAFYQGVYAQAV